MNTQADMDTHTDTHAYACMQAHSTKTHRQKTTTYVCLYTMYTCTCMQTVTPTDMCAGTQYTDMHTCVHAYTHTCTHACMRVHTHTHTCLLYTSDAADES